MWDIIKNWIFDVIQFFYNFCGDWGLAIIIVTVIFRILVAPLMHKQAKSSYQMQKVQPLMQEDVYKRQGERNVEEVEQRLLDEVHVVALDPCLDEVVVRREHEEALAHGLRLQTREERVYLRRVNVVVAFYLGAYVCPCLVKLAAVHAVLPVEKGIVRHEPCLCLLYTSRCV